jgi:hypothetical protein
MLSESNIVSDTSTVLFNKGALVPTFICKVLVLRIFDTAYNCHRYFYLLRY